MIKTLNREESLFVLYTDYQKQVRELEAENKRLREVAITAWNEMRDMATRLNWEGIPQSYVDAMSGLQFPDPALVQRIDTALAAYVRLLDSASARG
jgi:hypothetical protein